MGMHSQKADRETQNDPHGVGKAPPSFSAFEQAMFEIRMQVRGREGGGGGVEKPGVGVTSCW